MWMIPHRLSVWYLFYYLITFQDPCDPSPCQNGGTCRADGDRYQCDCTDGYTGRDCEIEPIGNNPFRANDIVGYVYLSANQ